MTDLTQFFNFNRPPNGTFGQQSLSGHSVVGQQQASFDINEFPSLSKMSLLSQMRDSSRTNYVSIAKDNTTTSNNQSSSVDNAQSEFTISSEDFPALPGSNNPNVSIIGTKSSGASIGGIKASSSSSTTTSSLINQTISGANNNGGFGSSSSNGGGSGGANPHEIGATAAIDQCGRDKSYFSPIVSTPQKSMWMNGGVDRSNILGSPAMASSLDQKKVDEQGRFKTTDSPLNEYSLGGHASDFYNQATNEASLRSSLSPGKEGGSTSATTQSNGRTPAGGSSSSSSSNNNNNNSNGNNLSGNMSKGVQISQDGRVTNIPSSMVTDQFGMIGLLAFLRAAETDPNLASVTFGTDLTALGLNLTATEKLYPSFAGPWSDQPLKVYEIDYPVPSEYLVNSSIRDKLTQITLKRYHEDTIFFLFYMFPNDMLQIAAAIELYSREWRYHKEEKVWITRAPGIAPSEKTNSYERGTYYIFDALLWRRVPREFVLEYDRLESKPTI